MKDRLYLDVNVVVDFITDRSPYADAATELFRRAETGKVELYISVISWDTVYYIARTYNVSHDYILSFFRKMTSFAKIVSADGRIVSKAAESGFHDFEDAMQYYCAQRVNDLKAIITRDKKGFNKGRIPAMSAEQYLKSLN